MTPLEKQLHKERRLLYRRRVSIPDFVRQILFSGMSLAEVTKRVQYAVIAEVLHRTGGNQCQAARLLNVHRNTLSRQIAEGRKLGMLESWEVPKMLVFDGKRVRRATRAGSPAGVLIHHSLLRRR